MKRHPMAVLRKQQSLTQSELAGRATVSRSYVVRIEKGWQLAYPTDELRRLAQALDAPVSAIVADGQLAHDDCEAAAHFFGLDPSNPATGRYLTQLREEVTA